MTHKISTHQAPARSPLYVVEASTNIAYVLIPAEEYRRLLPFVETGDRSVAETYPLQEDVARASGWDDAKMDAYDDYDAHRRAR